MSNPVEARIICGDALTELRKMPDCSVQMVCTSPPYWNLRSYGDLPGEMGREETIAEYIGNLVEVLREVRRVLKRDGMVFLNVGDSYANDGKWGGSTGGKHVKGLHGRTGVGRGKTATGLKPKDRCLIPERLIIALQDDGWWTRQPIIWNKPAPMPSSAKDRCTDSFEWIWLLTKSAKYKSRFERLATPAKSVTRKMPDGWDTGEGAHGTIHRNGREKGRPASSTLNGPYRGRHSPGVMPEDQRRLDKQRGVSLQYDGFNERWDASEENGKAPDRAWPRSVWTFSTAGYKKAHYATFPEELPKRCILAGSGEGDLVLDPFCGTGTTLAVALALGRSAIGIELSPEYVALAQERLRMVTPALALEAPDE